MVNRKITDLRSVLAYLMGLKNEIAIDLLRYKSLEIEPKDYGYLPRPTIWISRLKPYRAFLPILSFLWRYIFSYIFLFLTYLKYILRFTLTSKKVEFAERESALAIGFCERSIDVVDSVLNDKFEYKWLIPDWIDSSQVKDKSKILNLLTFLSLKDINRALYLSLLSSGSFNRKMDNVWKIQLYTSFKWFIFHNVLLKTNTDLITTEHYDRYAVLADNIIQHKGNKNKLTMIQHGFLTDGTTMTNTLYLPTKLNYVSEIYVYDKASEDFYRNNILGNKNSKVAVSYFTSKLRLSKVDFTDVPIILFVGNAICEELHVQIINLLQTKYKIKAYYKPHPTEKPGKSVLKQQWSIIEDRQFFPEVDFLITYPSTLINEYEYVGIKSLVHPINLSPEIAQDYISKVESKIESTLLKKNNS